MYEGIKKGGKKKEGEFKEREVNTNLLSPCDRKFQMFVQTSSQFLTCFYQQCIEYEDRGQARAWGLTISLSSLPSFVWIPWVLPIPTLQMFLISLLI
jgi:hypothetical protein